MKIVEVDVHGFGVWNGLRIERLSDTLNVFYGPNEAGKTTLLEFLRGVLYGWHGARRRYLPPVRGGRGGGRLLIDSPNGTFHIERFDETPPGGPPAESLRIVDPQGARHDDRLLDTLLGGIDEATFHHVFAFGLSELQRLDTLSDTEAAQWLFRISAGLDRVSLIDVIQQLDQSRRRVLAPSKHHSQVGRLLERRKQVLDEIAPLRGLTRQYADLVQRRDDHQRRVEDLDQKIDALQQRLRLVEAAVAVRDHWHQRRELNRQLADMPSIDGLPPRALARLERLGNAIHQRRRQWKRLAYKGRKLARRLQTFDGQHALARHAVRIEALLEQRPWIVDEQRRIDALQEEVGQLERQLGIVAAAGDPTGSNTSTTEAVVHQPARIKRLRRLAREVVSTQHRCQELERQLEPLRRQARDIDTQIGRLLREHADAPDITTAMRQCGQRVTTLRHRVQADERIEQLVAQQRDLEEQTQSLVDGQLLPGWLLSSLGGLFALGAALILLSFLLPTSIVGSAGWTLASLGGLGLVGAVGAKFFFEHTAAQRLESAQRQLDLITSQLKQAKQERKELDAQLPPGAGPLLSRLSEAEQAMQSLEQALPLEAQRQALATQLDDTGRQLTEAEQAFLEAQQAWEQELLEQGLPEEFAPDDLRRLMRERSQHNHLRSRLDMLRQELAARRRSLESVELRALELAEQAGIEFDGNNTIQYLDALGRVLREHQTAAQQRESLRSRLVRLRRRRARLKKQLAGLTRRRRRLLRLAGVVDEAEFRRRAGQQARWEELARRRDMLSTHIAAALAGQANEEALEELLNTYDNQQLIEQRQGISTRLEQLRQRQRRLIDQCGQLTQQLKTLAHDRRLPQKYVELDQIHQQLAESIARWQVLLLSHHVADRIRQDYESHRQPETLKAASGFLQHLTDGRYRRVWTPVGSHALRVDNHQGQSLPIEVLSRGAREQLFLALRLALTESYADRGIRLPLVLDDLLVNFDTHRARAAAHVLQDFAQRGHQLLVFTCHEHIVALFQKLRAEVRELPSLDSASHTSELAVSPPSSSRRRRSAGTSKRSRPAAAPARKAPAASVDEKKTTRPRPASRPPASTTPPHDATQDETSSRAAQRPTVSISRPEEETPSVRSFQPHRHIFDTTPDIIIVEPDEMPEGSAPSADATTTPPEAAPSSSHDRQTLRFHQPAQQRPHRTVEVVEEEPAWSFVQDHSAEEFAGEFAERVFVSRTVDDDTGQGQSIADTWTPPSESASTTDTTADHAPQTNAPPPHSLGVLSVVIDEEHRTPLIVESSVPTGETEEEKASDEAPEMSDDDIAPSADALSQDDRLDEETEAETIEANEEDLAAEAAELSEPSAAEDEEDAALDEYEYEEEDDEEYEEDEYEDIEDEEDDDDVYAEDEEALEELEEADADEEDEVYDDQDEADDDVAAA